MTETIRESPVARIIPNVNGNPNIVGVLTISDEQGQIMLINKTHGGDATIKIEFDSNNSDRTWESKRDDFMQKFGKDDESAGHDIWEYLSGMATPEILEAAVGD